MKKNDGGGKKKKLVEGHEERKRGEKTKIKTYKKVKIEIRQATKTPEMRMRRFFSGCRTNGPKKTGCGFNAV